MSNPTPTERPKPGAIPFILAGLLAVGGFFAAAYGTGALGHGTDAHALRVAALAAALFVGSLIAFWPGRKLAVRAVALLVAVGLGVAAWAFVPCRTGGPSLVLAVAERDSLKQRLTEPKTPDPAEAAGLRSAVDSLAKDFPSLASGVQLDLTAWGDRAVEAFAARFRQLPPDDVTAARNLAQSGRELSNTFPLKHRDAFDATDGWLNRASAARTDELAKLPAGDFDGFERTAAARRALAEAFPMAGAHMQLAEQQWATRTAHATIASVTGKSPKELRAACRELAERLAALNGYDDGPGRYSPARHDLFAAAHEAAQFEARSHIEAERYDRAFGVARTHAVEWSLKAGPLDAAAQRSLAELRETCRYLGALAEKAGDAPDTAPPPRSKP